MKGYLRAFAAPAFFLSAIVPATACIWDHDTIATERTKFPGVQEILTGNFPRHSKEFHEWRKARSQDILKQDPSKLPAYDDLAVSQHKLGDHAGAIATMIAKDKIKPGVYETYSNLGTFYIYTGKLEEARKWISKALEINPDAHFGREKYQLWLVEWLLAGKPEPEPPSKRFTATPAKGFAAYILGKQKGTGQTLEKKARQDAIKGITGMMRFADFDNPLLLEALGDVLCTGDLDANASNLAIQCYVLASQGAPDKKDKLRIAEKLAAAGEFLQGFNVNNAATTTRSALAPGVELNKQVRKAELEWIKEGKDVSAEFVRKYLKSES